MNSMIEGVKGTLIETTFVIIESILMGNYPDPLTTIEDPKWAGYCPQDPSTPRFQISKPIDIDALVLIESSFF